MKGEVTARAVGYANRPHGIVSHFPSLISHCSPTSGPLRGWAFWLILGCLTAMGGEEAAKPAGRPLPALGSAYERRVDVAWNQYYDTAALTDVLKRLTNAFPELAKLYSVGKSYEGRDLWCLEVTSRQGGPADRKPGMYIDGNIHGNEVQGSEVVAYTAWYLLHQYGRLAEVTDLLDHIVFYLIPTTNPDGRDRWMHGAHTASSSRSGVVPEDNDRDGLTDEDDSDDLDGDGAITQMRIKDPNGRWKAHPDFPEYLVVRAAPDEPGQYTLLGFEGIDNDGDGQVNEDPVGGYDANRNWAWDWQPNYLQYGAMDYPFSLPETRAISDFVLKHPNIGAAQSYHNNGGMILRNPGREGGVFNAADDEVLSSIARRGEKILPFYRSMVIWKDLYTVWGGQVDWLYGARGILTFTCEIWNSRSLSKTNAPTREEEIEFLKYVLLKEGLVAWHEVDHPTYGKVEIGGRAKTWGRTPVSFLLEEECHRNMAFTLYHAAQLPRVTLGPVKIETIDPGLYRVWVTLANSRMIPSRTEQDVRNRINSPDILTLEGAGVKVLSSGLVTDPYFRKVEAVKRRPERIEINSIPGMGERRVQFVITGQGDFTLRLDSVKGGLVSGTYKVP